MIINFKKIPINLNFHTTQLPLKSKPISKQCIHTDKTKNIDVCILH